MNNYCISDDKDIKNIKAIEKKTLLVLLFLKKIFCLFERARERAGTSKSRGAAGEGEAERGA